MIIEHITSHEFENGLKKTRCVVIPFGSTEEHGSHLPLSTDTIQAYEVAKAASRLIPLFVAPPLHYGCCRSTSKHPGTISISTNTLKAFLKDIVCSFHEQGMRQFIVFSGHAGSTHKMALIDAGEELIRQFLDISVAVLTEYDLAYEEGKELIETKGDSHAGEIETSRILHLNPELVKGCDEREFPSFPKGMLVRDKRKYWKNGVWGDPTKSSREKGERINDLVVKKLVEYVLFMENFVE